MTFDLTKTQSAATNGALQDLRGGPSMPSQTVQPALGALLGDWISWIAETDDDEECSRRLGIASGKGADPWRIARHLQRQSEEQS